MKSSVLIRVDASSQVGRGHFTRMLSFGVACRQKGLYVQFVISSDLPSVIDALEEHQFSAVSLLSSDSTGVDLEKTLDIIKKVNACAIITDISNGRFMENGDAYADYLYGLSKTQLPVVCFDGLTDDCISRQIAISADYIVVPYVGAKTFTYKCHANTKFLLGADYSVIPVGLNKRKRTHEDVRPHVEKVIVSLGGGNVTALLFEVAATLKKALNLDNVHFTFVMGPEASLSQEKAFRKLCQSLPFSSEVVKNPDSFYELLGNSDLAIVGSGLTKYETAYLGVPTIVLWEKDEQELSMRLFEQEGTCKSVRVIKGANNTTLLDVVYELCKKGEMRQLMTEKGRKLIDGNGANRIVSMLRKDCLI